MLLGIPLIMAKGSGGRERRCEEEEQLLEDEELLLPMPHALLTLGALV